MEAALRAFLQDPGLTPHLLRSNADFLASACLERFPVTVPSAPQTQAADDVDANEGFQPRQKSSTVLLRLLDEGIAPALAIVALQLHIPSLHDTCAESFIRTAQSYLHRLDKTTLGNLTTEVADVCCTIARLACASGRSRQVCKVLRDVAIKAAPNANCLTSIHADFLQACIAGKLYGTAISFLNSLFIVDFEFEKTATASIDVFRFYYYAGICYAAVKKYSQALQSLNMIITAPAPGLSVIVISAIKKAKLISLIEHGEKYSTSSNVAGPVMSFLRTHQQPYDDISKAFVDGDFNTLQSLISTNRASLQADNNFGLAKQALEAWKTHQVSKLSQVYVTFPMNRLMQQLCVETAEEAVSHVQKSIASGRLVAKIESESGIVKFGDASSTMNNDAKKSMRRALDIALADTMKYSTKIRELHKELITSNNYIINSSAGRSTSWIGSSAMDVDM